MLGAFFPILTMVPFPISEFISEKSIKLLINSIPKPNPNFSLESDICFSVPISLTSNPLPLSSTDMDSVSLFMFTLMKIKSLLMKIYLKHCQLISLVQTHGKINA